MVGKARKRGVGPRRAARAREEEEEQEEQGPPPSPGSPSYFQDQVDAFHEARAQAALAPSWSDGESGAEDPEEEEEVLGLDVAEEEEEEDEDDEEDAGSVGGSSVLSEAGGDADPSLSWGRRKGFYYDTDYGAPRGGRPQSQQEAEEAAREEEEEVLGLDVAEEEVEESEEEEEPIARLTQEQEREEEENPGAKRKKEPEPEEEPSAKRAITYQIAKNKGLTPRRKKRDRNPRVKHREKFRRATIRRRGQVRLPRTEMHKYAGELSGIRAGVKKSIRLK